MAYKYEYETEPFEHQHNWFEKTRDLKSWAFLWEQGTGKTKPTIDTAAYLFEQDKIDAVLIVAPNGVHLNWLKDEFPKHFPKRLRDSLRAALYVSSKAKNVSHKKKIEALLNFNGLSVLSISYDGLKTDAGREFVRRFLARRRVLYIVDEGHRIKNPKAKQTKLVLSSSKLVDYKRLLTGTPITTGPFDLFSQLKFVDEGIWKQAGLSSFGSYKTRFANLKRIELPNGGIFEKVLNYRDIPVLQEILSGVSCRVTKDEVLDLPPKLYSKLYFDVSPAQAKLIHELKTELIAELRDHTIETPSAIVWMLRVQEILSGFVRPVAGEKAVPIDMKKNARLDAAVDYLLELPHPAIVWARFAPDIDLLMERLNAKEVLAGRYDGRVSDDEAEETRQGFIKGNLKFFVANAQKGQEGLTLTQARTVMYYNNTFKLGEREQSEDRAHRIGQEHPVNYVDVVGVMPDGKPSLDEHIAKALREKKDIASRITGDEIKNWI